MQLGQIATKARSLTNTDTVSYPDANLLIDINIWYQKIVSMILEAQDESDYDDPRIGDYPILTTPLVAGQRDYSIPVTEKVLKIKKVDVTYDGQNWYRATPVDDGVFTFGDGNNSNTDQYFTKIAPKYDIKYNSIFLYPVATADEVAAGAKMRVEWTRNVQEFTTSDYSSVLTDSTVIPGFDDPFHPMLAWGAAYELASSKQLPQLSNITSELQDWEQRLRAHYGRKVIDRNLAFSSYQDLNYGR